MLVATGYLAIAGAVMFVLARQSGDTSGPDDMTAPAGLLWPVTLPLFLGWFGMRRLLSGEPIPIAAVVKDNKGGSDG